MKISVVTANFNQADWLSNCLSSIHSQQYPHLEHIVIDGGSTDGSQEIIKRYSDHIHYWCSEPDGGQYDAINKGFDRSSGAIMAFLNSDDIYLPWTLRTVAAIFTALPEVEWLASTVAVQLNPQGLAFVSGQSGTPTRRGFLDGLFVPGARDSIGCIVQEGVFWRRSLWERSAGRLNTEHSLAADFDLWCQFFRHAELYTLAIPLAAMTRQPQQRSNDSVQYRSQCLHALRSLQRELRYPSVRGSLVRFVARHSRLKKFLWPALKRTARYKVFAINPITDPQGYHSGWKLQDYFAIL